VHGLGLWPRPPSAGAASVFRGPFSKVARTKLRAKHQSVFVGLLKLLAAVRAVEPFPYLNNGDFTFTDVSEEAGVEEFYGAPNSEKETAQSCNPISHDYNNDRYPDIIVANCISESFPGFYVFKNNGERHVHGRCGGG